MSDRYYSAQPIAGTSVTLDGSEAHHLLHVMRAQPGFELTVFDGQGGQFDAVVAACGRATVELTVGERQPIERELSFELTLAVSLPKGDRQRWLVEKCVELGVSRLVPLQTTRSNNKSEPGAKLDRYVIEASKQCGRNRLMSIEAATTWSDFLPSVDSGNRLIAHPGGKSLTELCQQDINSTQLCLAVGPEGGFTDDEVSQAVAAGWHTVGLGDRILRIETAALALVSVLTMPEPRMQ